MNPCQHEQGEYPAQPDPTCLKDCETSSDNGHISLIEVPERLGRGLTKQTLGDSSPGIATLLNRHLGDTRQWFTVLFKGSGISDYIYVWISGNSEIVLNANAASAVRLHVQPFTSWRRSHSRGPDHDLACDTHSSDDHAVRVNPVNAVPQSHFDAKIFQPVLGRVGEFGSESTQDSGRHV